MRLLKLTALLVLTVTATYLGAVWGGRRAGPHYAALFAPSDAAGAVMALRHLRKNETERAIEILEQSIDDSMERAAFFDSDLDWLLPPVLGDAPMREARLQMIDFVSKYEKEFPYKTKLQSRVERFEAVLGAP